MIYKEFTSDTLSRIREDVKKYNSISFIQFDPQVDFERITYGRKLIRHENTTGLFLEIDGHPIGFADGDFGPEGDTVFAYLLISFPACDMNYEFIAYRYNPDKFFLFKNSRLLGSLNGQFVSDLTQVSRWELVVDDKKSGFVEVPDHVTRDCLEIEFDTPRDSIPITIFPPPKYTDFISAINYYLRRTFMLPLGENMDFVMPDHADYSSLKEQELFFCSFIFFRTMVFRQ